jgi:hypothetical protein
MDIKLHRLESFSAQDTQGKAYKVYGYELMARAYPWLDAAVQWEPTGVVEYKLASGEHLDMARDGTLQGAQSGVCLHRLHSASSDTAH